MPDLIAIYICLQIIVVAWFDFKTKKISNIWPISNIIFSLLLPWVMPEIYHYHLELWVVPLAFLIVGFVLFKLDIMGAGDSKYLFSLFLLIPQSFHENFLLKLLSVTVFVGASLLVWRICTRWSEFKLIIITRIGSLKTFLGGKFTYGPVMMVAWLWFYVEIKSK